MKPTADQLQRVQATIREVFTPDTLRQMLASILNTDIDHIAPHSANFTVVVEAVVDHFARKKDGLHSLLDAALQAKPKSPHLIALYAELGDVTFDPLPRRIRWYAWTFIAAGVTAAVAFIVVAITAIRPPPDVTLIEPTSTPIVKMTGDLNIAVAQFGVLQDDAVGPEPEPNGLADTIYESLKTELTPLIKERGFAVQWLEPAAVGVIAGDSQAERTENAEAGAELHRADLLIYGYVSSDPAQTVVEPLLFVASRRLLNAQELAGPYSMGDKMEVSGDIDHNPVVSKNARSKITMRASALAQFALGLGYFAEGQYDNAKAHFDEANRQASTAGYMGREATLLFLGSTAGYLGDLPLAGQYYAEALAENNDYARAQLGAAQVEFQLAKDDCAPGSTDIEAIKHAIEGYDAARDARDQHPLAEIPVKAAFFKGQAYECLTRAEGIADFTVAKSQLTRVAEQYDETENQRIRYLAAEANNLLGLIAVQEAEAKTGADRLMLWRAAETSYRKAIELSLRSDRKATYSLWLTQLTIWIGDAETSDFCPDAYVLFEDAERYAAQFQAENPSADSAGYATFRDSMIERLAQACPEPAANATP